MLLGQSTRVLIAERNYRTPHLYNQRTPKLPVSAQISIKLPAEGSFSGAPLAASALQCLSPMIRASFYWTFRALGKDLNDIKNPSYDGDPMSNTRPRSRSHCRPIMSLASLDLDDVGTASRCETQTRHTQCPYDCMSEAQCLYKALFRTRTSLASHVDRHSKAFISQPAVRD